MLGMERSFIESGSHPDEFFTNHTKVDLSARIPDTAISVVFDGECGSALLKTNIAQFPNLRKFRTSRLFPSSLPYAAKFIELNPQLEIIDIGTIYTLDVYAECQPIFRVLPVNITRFTLDLVHMTCDAQLRNHVIIAGIHSIDKQLEYEVPTAIWESFKTRQDVADYIRENVIIDCECAVNDVYVYVLSGHGQLPTKPTCPNILDFKGWNVNPGRVSSEFVLCDHILYTPENCAVDAMFVEFD